MSREEFTVCKEYASYDLIFSSYALWDLCMGDEDNPERAELFSDRDKQFRSRFDESLKKLIDESVSKAEIEDVINELKALRAENKNRMEFFARVTDRLVAYEYVLNRVELNYSSDEELEDFLKANPEDAFLNRIMIYLVGKKDKQLFGTRLNSIVGEIPIQITKNKLFEFIDRALTLYIGSDETAVDELLYMLRMTGLVYEPGESLKEYPMLDALLADLEAEDADELAKEQYLELKDRMFEMSAKLDYIMDYYTHLQRCVNDVLSLCIISKWLENVPAVAKPVSSMLETYLEDAPDFEGLVEFEGRIEGLSDRLQATMGKVSPSGNNSSDDEATDIAVVTRLLSNSLFADIDPVFVETKEVTKEMIREKADKLFEELGIVMKKSPKRLKKAIIAKVLEKLPPFMTEQSEIENYIRVNLFNCRSKAEKCAVMAILIDMMENDV